MMQHLEEIIANATTAIDTADSLVALDEVRVQYLGKKRWINSSALQSLGKLPPEGVALLVKESTKRKVLFNKRSQLAKTHYVTEALKRN